jgi:hypothetical protein
MNLSRKRHLFGALAGAAVVAVLHPTHTDAAVVFNAAASGVLTTDASYAQQVTVAGPDESYSITSMTLGINWYNISAGTQDLFLDFYTGASTSPTATDDFSSANFIVEKGLGIGAPGANGGYVYTLNFTTPVLVPSNTFDIASSMTNSAGTAYSTAIGGILSSGTPSVGSDPGFVWVDSNEDGTFAGSEQSTTAGGGTTANFYTSITATAIPVPEPIGAAAILGIAGLGLSGRRRRASRR